MGDSALVKLEKLIDCIKCVKISRWLHKSCTITCGYIGLISGKERITDDKIETLV